MFHGYWWRAAHRYGPFDAVLPTVDGPTVCFPRCRPPNPSPVALDAEQAAVAARLPSGPAGHPGGPAEPMTFRRVGSRTQDDQPREGHR